MELHLSQLGHELTYQGEGDVTYENAQARMRTYLLMDAANMKNGLVVGTGDLSELATRFIILLYTKRSANANKCLPGLLFMNDYVTVHTLRLDCEIKFRFAIDNSV